VLQSTCVGVPMNDFWKEFWQKEDLGIGASWGFWVGLAIQGWTGALILTLWGAVLWRLGGMGYLGTKGWRRVGIPLVMVALSLVYGHGWALLGLTAIAPLSIGYGIPQEDESPSALGKFWGKLFPLDIRMTNMFTRGTCHLLTAICLIPTWV
jgi:hypothetical protein